MRVQDVSSPARVRHSDRDIAVWMSNAEWAALTRLVSPEAKQVRVGFMGIDAYLVDVETDITSGLPSFTTVGLPQGAVKEGRERVGASIA